MREFRSNWVDRMTRFKTGELVALRESATTTKGQVVSDDGEFVRVRWQVRFGMEGKTSTHRPADLRKVSASGARRG